MTVKVFLAGEGNNELGGRWQDPVGKWPGVLEVLLRRVRATGWQIDCAMQWKSIRKFRAGAGRAPIGHDDARTIQGLVLTAYESSCEMLAFTRDSDDDEGRAEAIRRALDTIEELGFADDFRYHLEIVGGIAKPKLEGWILCLHARHGTDEMNSAAVDRALPATGVALKSTAAYVEIAETGALPDHDCSLKQWLDDAKNAFARLIDDADSR